MHWSSGRLGCGNALATSAALVIYLAPLSGVSADSPAAPWLPTTLGPAPPVHLLIKPPSGVPSGGNAPAAFPGASHFPAQPTAAPGHLTEPAAVVVDPALTGEATVSPASPAVPEHRHASPGATSPWGGSRGGLGHEAIFPRPPLLAPLRRVPTPAATIPAARAATVWKTPYSYGYFGARGGRHWSKHHGYRDRSTIWTWW